ncbi:MAG TPA: hypothetical protein VMV50_02930 [Candidatus Paceibacterota bacterium]|nr:hypothetical protein [Candidatus Paceibacterota bacterium]
MSTFIFAIQLAFGALAYHAYGNVGAAFGAAALAAIAVLALVGIIGDSVVPFLKQRHTLDACIAACIAAMFGSFLCFFVVASAPALFIAFAAALTAAAVITGASKVRAAVGAPSFLWRLLAVAPAGISAASGLSAAVVMRSCGRGRFAA